MDKAPRSSSAGRGEAITAIGDFDKLYFL
jgi:hypothetical protein